DLSNSAHQRGASTISLPQPPDDTPIRSARSSRSRQATSAAMRAICSCGRQIGPAIGSASSVGFVGGGSRWALAPRSRTGRRSEMGLSNAKVEPTLPVSDVAKAKEFYEGKLGLSGGRD